MVVAEPNDQLRGARERVESPNVGGDHLSRQELAELVNAWVFEHTRRVIELDANYIGKLEQGRIRWPQVPDRRAGFRAVLGVATDAELGFRRPRRCRTTVRGVDRQQFIRAGFGVSVAAVAGESTMAELITPAQVTPIPSVVGVSHVAQVRAAATVFADWDNRYGSGFVREAVNAQLRYCAELLNARCPEAVRAELFAAVGYLGNIAAFTAFDTYAHHDARRMFRFALSCAEQAGDWSLRARILANMARQALCCGDPDTALTSIELALVRADRLTATERARLHTARARVLATLGRVQEAATAVGMADEQFSRARAADTPSWMAHYDDAVHCGEAGHAQWEAAVHGRFVPEVRHRLAVAVAGHDERRTRLRAMTQTKLASLIMVTGDPREAAALGGQVLDWAGTLRSRRAVDDLRELRRFAEPHARLTEVADLRHRIGTVIAAV
ncbi:MAG: XRE family transcriptional regulator [Actinomycetota bacterium]|nr:XRE family transcriptional regulator [Actinomycetota bacterium]